MVDRFVITTGGVYNNNLGEWVKASDYEALEAKLATLVKTAKEVVRISDRKHDAWDRLKAAIKAAKVTP